MQDRGPYYPGNILARGYGMRFYHVCDVVGFVQRRLGPKGLSGADAAAFGRVADIGPLLSALKKAGAAPFRVERELAARGVRAEIGAAWRNNYIARATLAPTNGQRDIPCGERGLRSG